MEHKIIWTENAIGDLKDICDYIAQVRILHVWHGARLNPDL